jgi:hypothetical protein
MALGIGGRARAKDYPDLRKIWATNAARVRWNPVRLAKGLPALPLVKVRLSDDTHAVFTRECRDLARRRAAYDGVPYRDAMAWEPAIVRDVCEKLGIPYDSRRQAATRTRGSV